MECNFEYDVDIKQVIWAYNLSLMETDWDGPS